MKFRRFLIVITCFLFLAACSASDNTNSSSIAATSKISEQTEQITTAASEFPVKPPLTTTETSEATVSANETAAVPESAVATIATSTATMTTAKEIPQTPLDIPLSCSELGDGQIVLISWDARDDYDSDSYSINGRYITSDGALYEFEFNDNDYAEISALDDTGGLEGVRSMYRLDEDIFSVIKRFSFFLGYTDFDALNKIYDSVKETNTDNTRIDLYYFKEDTDDLAYSIKKSAADKIFQNSSFTYCYTLCDTNNIETLDDSILYTSFNPIDIIKEENGIRKMLLHGLSYDITIRCSKDLDESKALYPDKK